MKKMYEELVNALRKAEREHKRFYSGATEESTLMHEAADAIEELQEDNAALNGTVSNLIGQIAELSKPRWIPVTERMPEEWTIVLTFQPTSDDKGIIQTCVYIGIPGKWRQAWNHEFLDLPVTHWMPLPEPPKGE